MKRIISALATLLVLTAPIVGATTYTLGNSALLVGPLSGSGSVVLAVAPPTDPWTAATNAPWLHLADSFQSGVGSANVVFSFDANPGPTRSGTLTVGDQTVTVTQAGSTYITVQTINTLVSSGLNAPRGVAVDSAGNLFIADTGNSLIRKWSPTSQVLSTVVSTGLNTPYSVAVDGAGNVYIADSGNNAVKEWVAAVGNLTTLVSSNITFPSGVGVDPSGNVYIAEQRDLVIYEWNKASNTLLTLNYPNPPSICGPPGLAVDIAGNVYVDDTCQDTLQKWTAATSTVSALTPGWFYNPTGVAVDGSGNVYIADWADQWIWQWSATSGSLNVLVSGFNRPGGVAVDGAGNLYVADTANNSVKEWTQLFLDPSSKYEGLAAGSDSLPAVLPAAATQLASFSPTTDQPWLTITGVTNGVVYFSFTATTATRTGTIKLFGQKFPVTQLAPSIALGATSLVEAPAAGSDSVVLAVSPASTTWAATANAGWLHLSPANQSGTGSTNVIFSFDANPGPPRSATLTVAGQTLTVTQAGATYLPAGPQSPLVTGMPFAYGVAVDGAGNVYFSVENQSALKKWTLSNNTLSTLLTPGLGYPMGIAADSAGNLYVSDGNIKKWTAATQSLTTLSASGGAQVALDGVGNVYFANGNTIQVWTAANNVVSTLLSGFNGPGPVAVDVAGNVYVASTAGIQQWTPGSGALTTLAAPDFALKSLAVDGSGNLYLAAQNSYYDQYVVLKWTAASNAVTTLLLSGQADYFGAAVDAAGNLYYTDFYDGTVSELPNAFLDPSPKVEGLSGGHDALPAVVPATANLRAPFAPSSDSSWLTIAGVANGVVSFSFTTNVSLPRTAHIALFGKAIAISQSGPSFSLGTTALWEGPLAGSGSVALSVTPNFGVWSATNNVPWLHVSAANQSGTGSGRAVFSFDANPGATRSGTLTIAGQTVTVTQAGSTYIQVGPLTTLASSGLAAPAGIAVDGAGNVYLADTGNNAIEEWTPTNGVLRTLVSSGLAAPAGVAVDAVGNLYIADTGNNALKEWTVTNGVLSTLVSSGLAAPTGLAVDAAGNVYIADTGNNALKEWTATNGTLNTLVSSSLAAPVGVAVDVAGNVYIADRGNNAVKQWWAVSNVVTTLMSSGLLQPAGVYVDGSGNVFIADTGDSMIKKWTAASNVVSVLGASGLSNPAGLAVDHLGNVFIADSGDNALKELPQAFLDPTTRVETADAGTGVLPTVLPPTTNLQGPLAPSSDQPWLRITGVTNGVVSFAFSTNPGSSRTAHISLLGQAIAVVQSGLSFSLGTTALLVGPGAASNSVVLAVAPRNSAWTAMANVPWLHLGPANQAGSGSALVVFSLDANSGPTRTGTLTIAGQLLTVTQAGTAFAPANMVGTLVSSGLSNPSGLASDQLGNIYIADAFDNAIQKWAATNNTLTSLVSTGLSLPRGVAVDGAGNVYIADTFHSAVKKWSPQSQTLTPLIASGLSSPWGVGVDGLNNVYVANTGQNTVQEWVVGNNSVLTLVASGLSAPRAVAVDSAANVYITDSGHNAVLQWTPATGTSIPVIASGLSSPGGLAVDGAGNVFIADTGHNAIKKWTAASNTVATLVSSGLATPGGVALDGANNLYIVDNAHNAIKELPNAFVDLSPRLVGMAAGITNLPVLLPVTANLPAAFAPASDQTWLTVGGLTNGEVSLAFTANPGPARTAHLQLLGQSIPVIQGVVGTPPLLTDLQILGKGTLQFSFTNDPSASFTVLSTTNISLPLSQWTTVGSATNTSANMFLFRSQPTTNDLQRFYTVRSP